METCKKLAFFVQFDRPIPILSIHLAEELSYIVSIHSSLRGDWTIIVSAP